MKITAKKNPTTCDELSVYLGYPVLEWIQHPDDSFEIDLDVVSLTTAQRKALRKKLLLLPLHLQFETGETTQDVL